MKYPFCLFIILLLCFNSKNLRSQTAVVKGDFAGAADGNKIYIRSNGGIKDSTVVKDGGFAFSLNPGDMWDVFFIESPAVSHEYMFPLFLKANSEIIFSTGDSLKYPVISGDTEALEQNDFYQGLLALTRERMKVEEKMSSTSNPDSLNQLKKISGIYAGRIKDYKINWIKEHRASPFSAAVIRLYLSQPVSRGEDTLAEQYFNLLYPQAIEDNYQAVLLTNSFSVFNNKYWRYIPDRKYLSSGTEDKSGSFKGHKAPGFNLPDTSGSLIRLTDFRREILLIDFWASWCGPCRANNPSLKKLYKKYKAKGLRILSISVDTDPAKWKEAIRKDGMIWNHASDLSGLQ